MRIAITGANGFIGRRLVGRLHAAGFDPVILGRKRPLDAVGAKCEYIRYSLENGISRPIPLDCDAVVHCAYSMASRGQLEIDLNVNAVNELRRASAGRKFVFISSMSAHAAARSVYGRGKWKIENLLVGVDDLTIKPGLVVGSAGLFHRIRCSIRNLPFVPLFRGGSQPIQPIWVEDLATGIMRAIERNCNGTLVLGHKNEISIRDLYQTIMRCDKIRRPFFPVPFKFAFYCLAAGERCGLNLPVTSENLLGLAALRAFETDTSLSKLNLDLLGLEAAIHAG